jgi:hypothetical protein
MPDLGFMEFGKTHSQVHLDSPGLCPLCLERYIGGRAGGAKTQLVEEVVDGVKTGKWICPDGGRSYAKQFIDDTGGVDGAWPNRGAWPFF